MRIGIDIRSMLKQEITGIGYYTQNLVKYLCAVDKKNEYALYSYIRMFDFKRKLPQPDSPNFSHRIDRLAYRPEQLLSDCQIVQTSSNNFPKPKNAKLVVTVHDVIPKAFSKSHTPETIAAFDEAMKVILRNASKIITDSVATREDILNFYEFPENEIRVIYPGRDEFFVPLDDKEEARYYLKQKYNIPEKFLLYVGTIEPRKNVDGLVQAFKKAKEKYMIPHFLVIAGMKGSVYEEIVNLIKMLELEEYVHFLGYIPREDMNKLYNAAEIFIYPSFYEGFGFPILEAFSCRTPTITSDASSCCEVADEAALIVDPYNVDDMAKAMVQLSSDTVFRDELAERGYQRARAFSWRDAAEEFVEVFNEVSQELEPL